MDMFADVERLRANFNKADSAVEDGNSGLKNLAARCASQIVRESVTQTAGRANPQFVWNVYRGLWLPGVDQALAVALENKEAKPQVPEIRYQKATFDPRDPSSFDPRLITNLQQISNSDDHQWNVSETIAILRDYQANATAGANEIDLGNIAQRAEAAVGGNEMALLNGA